MHNLLTQYSKWLDNEKIIFKNILKDIVSTHWHINSVENKKWFKQQQMIEKMNQSMELLNKIIIDEIPDAESLSNEEWESIMREFNQEVFWVEDMKWLSAMFLSVYKWEDSKQNDILFSYRRDFVDLLNKEWIISIRDDLNLSKMFDNIQKEETQRELQPLKDLYEKDIELTKEKYWDDIIDKELSRIKGMKKRIDSIVCDIQIIKQLLEKITAIDSQEIKFEDNVLYFKEIEVYKPRALSNRLKFMQLLFTKDKWEYFSLKEIFSEIEWYWIMMTRKDWQKIYTMKDKINIMIEKKTWLTAFFTLWVWEHEGKICRNY